MAEPVEHALRQIQGHGLIVDAEGFKVDSKLHPCDVEGFKKGKQNGWYIASWFRMPESGQEVVVGACGYLDGVDNVSINLSLKGVTLTPEARERLKRVRKEMREQQVADQERRLPEVAAKAKGIWDKLPACKGSPYLERKRISAFGLKAGRNGAVVMPLRNIAGALTQLQFVQPDGSKRFLSGPGKKGSFHLVGEVRDDVPVVFCEGYATAASGHQATEWPHVVCVDAGNIAAVMAAWRSRYPGRVFLIAGDDDHEKLNRRTGLPMNAGREKALAAAAKFDAVVVFPRFADPAGKTDFNDLHVAEGLKAVREQLLAAQQPTTPGLAPAGAGRQGGDAGDWELELVRGDKGLKPMVHNIMLVLEHHPAWQGVLALDTFAQQVVKRRPPPYGGKVGPVEDADEIQIAAWFGRKDTYRLQVATGTAHEAAVAVAQRHAFHPVREYLQGLEWDGTTRLESFFPDHCNAADDEATRAFGRNFFISAVARIMRPGCKADLMLVLEGQQGARKSSLAVALAGEPWYVDVGTSPTDKDFYQLIQGRWLVEISEMASFAKSETSHIKRSVSVATDRFRPPYARNPMTFPRQCVFFGTSNDSDWQRDATGGRRFMPISVADVDIEAVVAVRDQLWAEALHRYEQGESWHELPDLARDYQDERYLEDVWAESIYKWLQGKREDSCYASGVAARIRSTTVSEILRRALDMDTKKQSRQDQMRVGQLMTRMGWQRKQVRMDGLRVWHYVRAESEA